MQLIRTGLGLFIAVVLMIMFAAPAHANEAVINEDNLNIRSGPGTEYQQIGQASSNEVYPIVQQEGDWVEIQLAEGTGWVTTEFITIETVREEISEKTVTIPENNTHLRSEPSTDGEIIHFAEKGESYQVTAEIGDWYEVTKDEVTGYVLKELVEEDARSTTSGFSNKTIVIDAGHGGHDVGAIGATGVYEKDIAYLTAMALEQELTMLGAEVLLTRPMDEYVSLTARSSYANTMGTDAFISIHYNSTPNLPQVNGVETFYYHDQDQPLAEQIHTEIIKETDADNRGVSHGDYLVIRQSFKPSALLELGFISNPEAEELLQNSAYQKRLVKGIVHGLGKYFAEQ
ncbi:N-acetylmuramoyl-L-alanine amidase [Lentibacillus sediminis]|uniref:N-acetylmuramoyl-L-alanine amidase n=1 Tax=Lentibacillus sediminis TaxID=1940529 RepID=UPI001EFD7F10|nr:N-acetylmuramoyl-L-alanine amidase [Lentibacillus sediminis]